MSIYSNTYKIIFIGAFITILPLITSAQYLNSNTNDTIKIQRIKFPVDLDGISNEPAWDSIKPLPIIMSLPNSGNEPSEHTEILLGYNNVYFYAAGRFYDSEPSKIQAASFKRDVWTYATDAMAIVIDAFNDNENAVAFFTTPAGTRTDVNILNDAEGAPGKNANTSWNTFWDVATVSNDDGWFIEMRIPFSSLKFEETDGQTVMGITAYRWIARKNEMNTFPLIPKKFGFWGAFKPSQMQKVLFEDIKCKNPVYITPYLLGGFEQLYELNNSETAYEKNDKYVYEAGLDIKYGITSNLTLDVSLNTDFAQVEADDQVINLTRYSLFFPEKRLFFQERQGNFEFRFEGTNRLFYSRRIGINEGEKVRIYGGVRVVGRAGLWDIGFLNMQTEKFNSLPSENFNVMRLRRQVFNQYSYIGGMVTSRIGNSNSWNIVYGIDGIFRLFEDDYLTLKWAQSFENNKQNQAFNLEPSKIYANWNRRGNEGLGYNLSYSRSGVDFNPGIGFESRDNYTRFGDFVQYGWLPSDDSKLLNHRVFIGGIIYLRNIDGKIESSKIAPGWSFETKKGSSVSISINQFIEDVTELFSFSDNVDVLTGKYTFYGIQGSFNTPKGSPYKIDSDIYVGSFYDGNRITLSLYPSINLSTHLQLEGMYQINRLEFSDRNQRFISHIGQLKISLFLNSKLSLISNAQYNSANNKIITNVRFRYNPREGNDLYIVYDEGLNTDREREIPILPSSSSRTIMLKYSYTFRVEK